MESNNGNPLITTKMDFLDLVMGDERGQSHIFHELAHITAAGSARTSSMYSAQGPGGVQATQEEFAANEAWANVFQRSIRTAMGFPPSQLEDYFVFGYGPAATYVPGFDPQGETVARAFIPCAS